MNKPDYIFEAILKWPAFLKDEYVFGRTFNWRVKNTEWTSTKRQFALQTFAVAFPWFYFSNLIDEGVGGLFSLYLLSGFTFLIVKKYVEPANKTM